MIASFVIFFFEHEFICWTFTELCLIRVVLENFYLFKLSKYKLSNSFKNFFSESKQQVEFKLGKVYNELTE